MKAILIKVASPREEELEFPGWLVPDTNGLLGVDMRHEADLEAIPPQPAVWVITHLPTGRRATVRERVIKPMLERRKRQAQLVETVRKRIVF